MWTLLAVGLFSILAEVVLLRELSVASYGVELIYLTAVGVWLLAGALGALAGRWPRRLTAAASGFLLTLFGLALPAGIVVVRAARLFDAVPGAYLSLPRQLLVVVVALAPASLLLGVLFQWAARLYIGGGRTLAAAYGIESAGGLVGGLGATLALNWGFQNFALATLCGCLALAAACAPPALGGSRRTRVCLAGLVLAAAILVPRAGSLDRQMTAWSHPDLLVSSDSPYGRVTLTRTDGQLAAFDNDALWFDTEGDAAESFTHLVLLQHPGPARVLLLGGGIEGLARYALEHAPRAIDYVELNPRMYAMVVDHLPESTRRSLDPPVVRVLFTDPRRFLLAAEDRYDAILVAMPEPASGAANRFYTREFFAACARRLTAGGVLGFRLQSAENFWTPLLTRRMASIYGALTSTFASVVVLPGTTNVFLASAKPLPADAAVLAGRLKARHIEARLVSPPYLHYLYSNDRRAAIADALATRHGTPNTDAQPICYEYAALMWLSRFVPGLAASDLPEAVASAGTTVELGAGAAVLLLFALVRRRAAWRRVLLVGVAGFAGMVLETILILHFQMKNGVLFGDIGVLLTAFMAGLAAGALTFGRRRHRRWTAAAVLGGLVVLSLFVSRAASLGTSGGLAVVTLLLAATGALVGALFAQVSRADADQARLVSPLYAADLVGGCLGSWLASLVMIPMAGLALSARSVAVLAALSLVLL